MLKFKKYSIGGLKKRQVDQSKQAMLGVSSILSDRIKELEASKKDLELEQTCSKKMNKEMILQNKNALKIELHLLKELKQKEVLLIDFANMLSEKIHELEIKNNQKNKRLEYVEHLNEEFMQVMCDQEKQLGKMAEEREWLTSQMVEFFKENILQYKKNENTMRNE